MNRRKAERWLSRYLDGELDPGRSARLERWLSEDASLRAQADAWRAGGDQLRGLTGVVPDPARGWADVRTALAEERARPGRKATAPVFGSPLPWAAAMLVLLLAAVGLGLWTRHHGEDVTALNVAEPVEVEWAETELPGASTMVFRDEETGLTVIWLVEKDESENGHAGS